MLSGTRWGPAISLGNPNDSTVKVPRWHQNQLTSQSSFALGDRIEMSIQDHPKCETNNIIKLKTDENYCFAHEKWEVTSYLTFNKVINKKHLKKYKYFACVFCVFCVFCDFIYDNQDTCKTYWCPKENVRSITREGVPAGDPSVVHRENIVRDCHAVFRFATVLEAVLVTKSWMYERGWAVAGFRASHS